MLRKILGISSLVAAVAALCMPAGWSQEGNDDRPPPPPPGGPHGGPGAGPKFADMDANGDGGVSLEEFSSAWSTRTAEQFKRMDENADAALSEEELAKRPGPPRGRGPEGRGPGGAEGPGAGGPPPEGERPAGPPPGRRGGGLGPMPPSPEALDANSDGSVTEEEFTAAWATAIQEHFARLDADSNGTLSEDELPKRPGPPPGGGREGGRPAR